MKRFIAERGLIISLEDLYEDVQSVLISNLTAYVKSIIYEPGLRIAEGDEFLVQQDGARIIADTGAIVFPNYDLWVPPTTGAQLSADISSLEVDAENNRHLAIYVILETEDTHPQRKMLDVDLFYTVQRNVVKMIICEDITLPPSQSFLLAYATLTPEHDLVLEDRRFDSILKLISRYDSSEWEPRASILPPVSDVTVSVLRQSDYKQSAYQGQSINIQSLPTDQLGGYHLNVSWTAPTLQEIESLHGVAYYKVVATPVTSGTIEYEDANISQIVLVSKGEIESKSIFQRVGCMIPCDLGVEYNVRVYRVSNMLNLRVENATDPISKTIGPIHSAIQQSMEVSINYAFSTRDIVSIQCAYDENLGDTMRVYAREYSGSAHSISDVYQWKYFVYEGPVGEAFFKTLDLSNTGLSVYIVIIGKYQHSVTFKLEHFGYDEYKTPWENIYPIVIQEADGGWAGRAAPSFTGAGTAIELDGGGSAIVTVTAGHNRKVGDYIYIDNSTLHAGGRFVNGWHEVQATGSTYLVFNESAVGGAVVGTCDVMGNAIFTETTPVGVEHHASSHFAGRFVRGHELVITNSSDGVNLPDGNYNVRDIKDDYWDYGGLLANAFLTIDEEIAWLGGNIYGDITFPTSNVVHSFEFKNDVYISQVVTGIRNGARIGDDGNPACIMTVTDGVTDHVLSVPKSGIRKMEFDLDYIPAGTTINIKLERNDDRFNLSSLIVFIYLQYRL